MPIHIETMSSELNVLDSELPLGDAQLEQIVRLVIERLEARQREARWSREATRMRRQAAPSPWGDEAGEPWR